MTRRHRVLAALGAAVIAAAGLLAVGARSQAFVRSLASDKAPLFQPGSCAWIAAESGGSRDLSKGEVNDLREAAGLTSGRPPAPARKKSTQELRSSSSVRGK